MLTLAGLGGAALSEGIRFLYGQADDLLKRRREARAGATAEAEPEPSAASTAEVTVPDHLLVARFEQDIHALMAELEPYRAGSAAPVLADPNDRQLVDSAEALRRILSVVNGVPIAPTREQPAPTVDVHLDVDQVAGYVAGVRGRDPKGDVNVRVKAGTVADGGEVVGFDLGAGS